MMTNRNCEVEEIIISKDHGEKNVTDVRNVTFIAGPIKIKPRQNIAVF
jgi:hypothetical protein